MAIVSTFEILLKSQLPTDLPPALTQVRNLSRNRRVKKSRGKPGNSFLPLCRRLKLLEPPVLDTIAQRSHANRHQGLAS
jgi:hypothetical protein